MKLAQRPALRPVTTVDLSNTMLALYIVSIYIWSGNAEYVVYSNIICMIITIIMLFTGLKNESAARSIHFPKPAFSLICFYIVCMLSVIWAQEKSASEVIVFRTLPLLLVFTFVLYNYFRRTETAPVAITIVYYSGFFLAIYVLVMQGGLSQYMSLLSGGMRIGGNVTNVNVIGMGTAMSANIAFYRLINGGNKIHALLMLICVFVGLGTGSNKFVIALLCGTIITLLLRSISNNAFISFIKYMTLICLVLGSIYFVLQLPAFSTMNQRFTGMINAFTGDGKQDISAVGRIELAEAGFRQFLETPILGIGIGNGNVVAYRAVGHNYYLHNNLIELLVGVGILGTLPYYFVSFLILGRLWSRFIAGENELIPILTIIIVWLILHWGFVAYIDKISYVYLAIAMAYAYPSNVKDMYHGEHTGSVLNSHMARR